MVCVQKGFWGVGHFGSFGRLDGIFVPKRFWPEAVLAQTGVGLNRSDFFTPILLKAIMTGAWKERRGLENGGRRGAGQRREKGMWESHEADTA